MNTYSIPGHERYFVHVDGSEVKIWSTITNRYLSTNQVSKDGYRKVKVDLYSHLLHRLVILATQGPPTGDRRDVNHKDGNKLNNVPNNLEYVTKAENVKHAIENGLHVSKSPELSGRYKDGRCANLKEYKRQWYLAKKEKRND